MDGGFAGGLAPVWAALSCCVASALASRASVGRVVSACGSMYTPGDGIDGRHGRDLAALSKSIVIVARRDVVDRRPVLGRVARRHVIERARVAAARRAGWMAASSTCRAARADVSKCATIVSPRSQSVVSGFSTLELASCPACPAANARFGAHARAGSAGPASTRRASRRVMFCDGETTLRAALRAPGVRVVEQIVLAREGRSCRT